MRERVARALALAVWCMTPCVFAQDAGVPVGPAMMPGPVDPNAPLPPGHPSMGGPPSGQMPAGHPPVDGDPSAGGGDPHAGGGDPHAGGGGGDVHRSMVPESFADEAPGTPPGSVEVRVIDASGNPIPEAMVRLGMMREGDQRDGLERRAGPDGVVRFEHLTTGEGIAYRLSAERDGARVGATPFRLPTNTGYRGQLVLLPVDHGGRGVLIWDAIVEMHFKDDRLVIVERMKLVNLSAMSLGGEAAHPMTYVPENGLRFGIPEDHTAFVSEPSMSDMRLTEEGHDVVFQGSIPPTTQEPMDVVFQYQVKLDRGDIALDLRLPISVVTATVYTEAPPGLTMTVDGMPAAELREARGERALVTGLRRSPGDPPVQNLRIQMRGIPAAAGPERTVAAGLATAVVLGAIGAAVRRKRAPKGRTKAERDAEQARLLDEAAELARQLQRDEVGPQYYARRRRELANLLAALLKESDAAA